MLDIRTLLGLATGKFCGTATNFVTLKPLLAQFLLSWNTANPSKTADRVIGVIAGSKSLGGASSCNEGYAAVNSNVAWVRAITDVTGAPSTTGALMAMELGHTMGVVPTNRDDDFSVRHSPNVAADGTAPQRAYNLSSRAYLGDNHTVMKLSGTWNQTNTVFEPLDWAYLLCILGGATADQCTTPGAVGTSTGVGAGSTFVISGTSDSTHTLAGTRVVESYFKQNVAQTPPDPASPYRLVRRNAANTILQTVGVPFTHDESNHGTTAGTITDLFSAALAFDDTSVEKIELWYGDPPGGVLLYTRARTGAPTVGGVAVGTPGVGTERASVAGDETGADFGSGNAVITPNGRYVAFDSFATNIAPGKTNIGIIDVFVRDRQTNTTVRVSLGPDADFASTIEGNGHSRVASISDDGRFVAFESDASNFNEIDNGVRAVYVHDRDSDGNGIFDETNETFSTNTSRVSVDSGGVPGNGASSAAAISADGNVVAFESVADNLDSLGSPDGSGTPDVFVHDRATGVTERVSIDSTGVEPDGGDGPSQAPAISADGRYVAFESAAGNLLGPGNDTNGVRDVFRRDTQSDITERMSVDGAGNHGNGISRAASITADGRFVAFSSLANNLVGGDTNAVEDIFVHDHQVPRSTERLSVNNGEVQGNAESLGPDISDNGRFVAFDSKATNLAPGDSNGSGDNHDVFVRDRTKGETRRLSVGSADTEAVGGSASASITGDGRIVAFLSDAGNLVGGDTNGTGDIFIRDLPPGEQPVDITASDDNPQDLVLDLFFTCPDGTKYPVAVAVPPIDTAGTTAAFETNFDPAVACAGGSLIATVTDGFTKSVESPPSLAVSESKSPTAAIYAPVADQNLPFRSSLALSGSGKDPENGELSGTSLQWFLTQVGQARVAVGSGTNLDLSPPSGGWATGDYLVTLEVTDSDANTVSTSTTVHVTHPLSLAPKNVNLIQSKNAPAGCNANYGPPCTTLRTVTVSAPAFGGNPGAPVAVLLCNAQAASRPYATGPGPDGDLGGGCDWGNGQGFGPVGVPNSGALNLDADGNLPGTVTLPMPSQSTLTAQGGALSSNPRAVCPPTPAQIAAGWTCVVSVGEFATTGYPQYTGAVAAYVKSPIPVMTCNGGSCPASIPTGTTITLTGVQFPCRTIIPDDPVTPAYDGHCASAWTNKTILLKRVSTGLIEGPAVVPTSQTAGLDGSYSITFPMPSAVAPGETYKVVPHAPSCSLPCDSGTANAAGKFFRHA